MREKVTEHVCLSCDGCGGSPGREPWEFVVCRECNGHGVVLYDPYQRKIVKFDVDKRTSNMHVRKGDNCSESLHG